MEFPHSYVDELVESYIGALINAKMWQTVASQYAHGNIPGPTLDSAQKLHQQALEPLWNAYKQERQIGNSPEQALQILLAKVRNL